MNPEDSKERATETVIVKCAGFPKELWEEWEADCKKNHGDCRWIKMWFDHLRAKELERFSVLFEKISDLEKKIDAIASEKKSDKIKTIGAEI